jgi:ribosomal protein L44E
MFGRRYKGIRQLGQSTVILLLQDHHPLIRRPRARRRLHKGASRATDHRLNDVEQRVSSTINLGNRRCRFEKQEYAIGIGRPGDEGMYKGQDRDDINGDGRWSVCHQ